MEGRREGRRVPRAPRTGGHEMLLHTAVSAGVRGGKRKSIVKRSATGEGYATNTPDRVLLAAGGRPSAGQCLLSSPLDPPMLFGSVLQAGRTPAGAIPTQPHRALPARTRVPRKEDSRRMPQISILILGGAFSTSRV